MINIIHEFIIKQDATNKTWINFTMDFCCAKKKGVSNVTISPSKWTVISSQVWNPTLQLLYSSSLLWLLNTDSCGETEPADASIELKV